MAAIAPRIWNETDIPAVASADLQAALSLWIAREREGLVLVADRPVATIETIERSVIGMFDDPARGLSVLYRLRSLIAALGSRRFRHLIRIENANALAGLVLVAASLRLNPAWGMSPVRLAWGLAAAEAAEVREAA